MKSGRRRRFAGRADAGRKRARCQGQRVARQRRARRLAAFKRGGPVVLDAGDRRTAGASTHFPSNASRMPPGWAAGPSRQSSSRPHPSEG
eukprot:4108650-Pyramimonas_sp.AAC.1